MKPTTEALREEISILFITSTNLAANPRLVKELKLATSNGFRCTVIQFHLGNWSDKLTQQLKLEFHNVKFIELSALRTPFVTWVWSSFLERLYGLLPHFLVTTRMLSIAVGKRSFLLLRQLCQLQGKFDWIIAHNPATFYPSVWYGEKIKAKVGIDVEDYHPGETKDLKEKNRMQQLMQRTLPDAVYCSYASTLIARHVKADIPFLRNEDFVIINGFCKNEFVLPKAVNSEDPLRLVWFSQFIGRGRGLEKLLPIVDEFNGLELHLIGNMNPDCEAEFMGGKNNVYHHKAMEQVELHRFLSQFDVGLAIEPGRDLNNKLALSNKIIAYAQSGLFILASHTEAQDEFLSSSNLSYLQVELTESHLRKSIDKLVRQKAIIRHERLEQFAKGRQYDWEKLSDELLKAWNS